MLLALRSLGAFRLALGIVLLVDVARLIPDFGAFFQAGGIRQSTASGILVWILLWIFLPVLATAFVVGLFTRLATLLSLVSLIVVQNANAQIVQGGDVLLRLLLIWSLFLPLGEVWSLDSMLGRTGSRFSRTTWLATWAITFQVCLVYWMASLLKTDPLWRRNGNALFYALNLEHFTTPFGLWMRQFPDLLRAITWAVPWFELLVPCLLFVPLYRDYCRLTAVALFVGFHLVGMEALLRIGLFPWVCATAWLVFIPDSFWDRISLRENAFSSKNRPSRLAVTSQTTAPKTKKFVALDYLGCFVVAISFLDVLAWNIASIRGPSSMQWMQEHDFYARIIRTDQQWNMYAPAPRKEHGWLAVPADLADGTEVDLFTGKAVSWEKPKDIGAYFSDDRWRRYLSNLFDNQDPQALQQYADYLVRKWNETHAETQKVQSVTITFMRQETEPDLTVTDPEKDVLYFHLY